MRRQNRRRCTIIEAGTVTGSDTAVSAEWCFQVSQPIEGGLRPRRFVNGCHTPPELGRPDCDRCKIVLNHAVRIRLGRLLLTTQRILVGAGTG